MDRKVAEYCGKKIAETLKNNILRQLHLGGKQSNRNIIGEEKVTDYMTSPDIQVYNVLLLSLF